MADTTDHTPDERTFTQKYWDNKIAQDKFNKEPHDPYQAYNSGGCLGAIIFALGLLTTLLISCTQSHNTTDPGGEVIERGADCFPKYGYTVDDRWGADTVMLDSLDSIILETFQGGDPTPPQGGIYQDCCDTLNKKP